MKMTLYYVGLDNDYQGEIQYIAGPFGAYWQACDAKAESNISSEHLRVVEQVIEVNE